MPRQSWSEKLGANLGGLLNNHREELFQKVDDVYHARRLGWTVKVSDASSVRPGYKLGIGALQLKAMAFATEEAAIVHTLAVLYSHDAHKNQLSTLPRAWQKLVKDRFAEIKAGTNMESVAGATGGGVATGNGYRIMSGGKTITLTFTPPPDFALDGKKGLKKADYLKNTPANRRKVEAAHAANSHVARKKDLRKKKGKTDPKKLFDSTPSPPVGSQVLVRWAGEPGPERDDSWRATVSRDADGELWLVGAQFDPTFGEPIPFDPVQDAWRMAPHVAPIATPWPRPNPQRPASTRPVPSSTQGPLVNITNSPTDSRAPPKRKAPPPPPPNLDDDATSRGRERRDDARTPPPPAPASTRGARPRAPAAEAPRGGGPPGMTGGDGSDGPWSRLTARTEAGDSVPPPAVGPNDGGDGLAPAPPPKRPKCDEVASSKKVLFLGDVLQGLEGANAAAAAAWCDANGATSMELLAELGDDVLIDAFSTAASGPASVEGPSTRERRADGVEVERRRLRDLYPTSTPSTLTAPIRAGASRSPSRGWRRRRGSSSSRGRPRRRATTRRRRRPPRGPSTAARACASGRRRPRRRGG